MVTRSATAPGDRSGRRSSKRWSPAKEAIAGSLSNRASTIRSAVGTNSGMPSNLLARYDSFGRAYRFGVPQNRTPQDRLGVHPGLPRLGHDPQERGPEIKIRRHRYAESRPFHPM